MKYACVVNWIIWFKLDLFCYKLYNAQDMLEDGSIFAIYIGVLSKYDVLQMFP